MEARAGSGVTVSGNAQTRVLPVGVLPSLPMVTSMLVRLMSLESELSNEGSVFLGGEHLNTVLSVQDKLLTIDTKTGYFSVEGGAFEQVNLPIPTYVDNMGQSWPYEVCTFKFGNIDIGGASRVLLRGDKSLVLETVAGGNVYLGVDFVMDGGDADTEAGYGGKPVLNPWRGRSSEKFSGFGPGGPTPCRELGNWRQL